MPKLQVRLPDDMNNALVAYCSDKGIEKSHFVRDVIGQALIQAGYKVSVVQLKRGGYRGGPIFGRDLSLKNTESD